MAEFSIAGSPNPPEFKVYLSPNRTDATVTGGKKGVSKLKYADPNYLYYSRAINNDTASCPGYVFLGWYTTASGAENGANIITSSTKIYKTTSTIYAHWAKFTVLSGTKLPSSGGQVLASIVGTAGHSWRVVSMSNSGSSWAYANFSGNILTIKVGVNYGKTRSTTIKVSDKFNSHTFSFTVTQLCSSQYVNDQFVTEVDVQGDGNNPTTYKKYCNLISGNEKDGKVYYEKKATAWFYNGGGCCTDSAMMDLLNRKLQVDGKLSKTYFFDIRDVIRGMAVRKLTLDKYKGVRVSVRDDSDGHKNWSPQLTGVPTRDDRGGERVDDIKTYSTASFTNDFGDHDNKGTITYTVKFEKYNASEADSKIRALLPLHPEGVYIYATKKGGGQHAFVITGTNANGELLYLDNGTNTSGSPVIRTTINGYTPASEVLGHIIAVGYIQ